MLLDSVELGDQLEWVDEFTWDAVAQEQERSLGGQLLVQEGLKIHGRPITLLDLATHSACLPRELPDPDAKPSDNPFNAFDRADYWKWMGTHKPAYAPATTTLYSNLAMACWATRWPRRAARTIQPCSPTKSSSPPA